MSQVLKFSFQGQSILGRLDVVTSNLDAQEQADVDARIERQEQLIAEHLDANRGDAIRTAIDLEVRRHLPPGAGLLINLSFEKGNILEESGQKIFDLRWAGIVFIYDWLGLLPPGAVTVEFLSEVLKTAINGSMPFEVEDMATTVAPLFV